MNQKHNFRKELEQDMKQIVLSQERREQIMQAVVQEGKHRRFTRKAVLAVALAAALTVSAFAAVPAIQEALRNQLGQFTSKSQTIAGVAYERDGIEIRPVSALSDSSYVRVYCEVQDKTGDRLSENMQVTGGIQGLPDYGMSVVGYDVISYDKETRTALIELYQTDTKLSGSTPASVSFSSFYPMEQFQVPMPEITIPSTPQPVCKPADLWTESHPEKQVLPLVPELTPAVLPGTEYCRLSSIGFDAQNRLHIQFALSDKLVKSDWNDSYGMINAFPSWKDSGEPLWKGANETEWDTTLTFTQNGTRYYEMVLAGYMTAADASNIAFDQIYGTVYLKKGASGGWHTDVTIEPAPSVMYDVSVPVGGITVGHIEISSISLFVAADSDGTNTLGRRPTSAKLRDGRELILTDNCVSNGWICADMAKTEQGQALSVWAFDEPIDPGDVVSLYFDGVTVPLPVS